MGKTKRADAGVRSIWALIALVAAFSLVPVTPGAAADDAPSPKLGAASRTDLPHSPDHVLVEVAPDANPENVLGKGADGVVGRWYTAPIPPGKTPIETVNALLSRPGVETVELDYRVSVEPEMRPGSFAQSQAVPVNDPLYLYQWHLPAVRADEAWSTSTGVGVVVAVLDTGISQGGVDLDCHTFVAPYNAITETAGAVAASDDNGHGTHVAGTVAQCTNNGVGVAGVAFDASLMPVKVLDNNGDGDFSWIAGQRCGHVGVLSGQPSRRHRGGCH